MDRGFCCQHISAHLNEDCQNIYNQFVSDSGNPSWGLTILGTKRAGLIVSVTDPDGRMLMETITETLDTEDDVHRLLIRSYEQWRSQQSSRAASTIGNF